MFESLEKRTLLSAEIIDRELIVTGTPNNDQFFLSSASTFVVSIDVTGPGIDEGDGHFLYPAIDRIIFKLGGGNDTLNSLGYNLDYWPIHIFGGKGKDNVAGGPGKDILKGQSGGDTLDGNGGRDKIYGASGNDKLIGGDGADLLNGAGGDDSLYGEAGDDTLEGGAGDDVRKQDSFAPEGFVRAIDELEELLNH